MNKFRAGVLYGPELNAVYQDAKQIGYALPAVNAVGTSSVNGILECAAKVNSPVIVQLSFGGGEFYAGKGLANDNLQASAAGCLSAAMHVHHVAQMYGVPVILHTDHCSLKNIHWVDQMIDFQEDYYAKHGMPLFSSHMLDLSEQSLQENIEICERYFKRLNAIEIGLEIELGMTGGEEDGVDKSELDNSLLYTHPADVYYAYQRLSTISDNFSIAAAFGNVHGVYKPGNVKLSVDILKNSQAHVEEQIGAMGSKPVSFVFHGGSGSSPDDIAKAIDYGVIKMNLDTDMQWAYCSGARDYFKQHGDYLESQIGNPEGEELPNKKYYDPRKILRQSELYFVQRLEQSFADLNCLGRNQNNV